MLRVCCPRPSRVLLGALALACFAQVARPAAAQEAAATAEALFREGRDLAAQGKFDLACPKFAASQRLDPGFGTLYNLGECFSRQGRTASAWAVFSEAAAMAKSAGQAEREAKAIRAANELEAKLERLQISVKARVPGLVIRRGGVGVDEAAWGSALPVDPGVHIVEATAPGRKPVRLEVRTAGPGQKVVVQIPELELLPAPTAPLAGPTTGEPSRSPSSPPADDHGARRIAGYALTAAGGVGLIVGAVMGANAKSSWDQAQGGACMGSVCSTQAGLGLANTAKTDATASTAAFVVGGALAATGIALVVTSLPPKAPVSGRLSIGPVGAGSSGGVSLQGAF